jgi:hypothetical protein
VCSLLVLPVLFSVVWSTKQQPDSSLVEITIFFLALNICCLVFHLLTVNVRHFEIVGRSRLIFTF